MADKDTLNLIKFKFGSFQSIKDLSSKDQSSFYFASDKPAFYNAGLWYGVSSLTSSVNEETGEVTLVINGDFGDNWESSQVKHTFVAGMTTQQKADLEKAVSFVNTVTSTEGEDTQTVIDKWNEIVAFLAGFKETDVLLERITTLETGVTNLKNTTITGGDGLKGGGDLSGNRTIAMGTPSTITDSSTNSVTTNSHTHAIDEASTEQRGIVRLNNTLTSESTDQALTANQGRVLKEHIDEMFELIDNGNGVKEIKAKYGLWSDSFISARRVDEESGGVGGLDAQAVWDLLMQNDDATKVINIAHIPDITVAKITDFTTKVGDLIANKADKATTLAGYGITDAVTLNTDQTISGAKTFRQAIIRAQNPSPLILDNTDPNYTEIGVKFILKGVNKAWVGYTEDTGVYFYTYNAPHRLGLKADGTAYVDNNTIYHAGNLSPVTTNTDQTITGVKTFSNLRVNNSTLVTNLNAEMVGGLRAANFARAINFNQGEVIPRNIYSVGYIVGTGVDGETPLGDGGGYLASVRHDGYGGHLFINNNGSVFSRGVKNSAVSSWKELAFTDTNTLTPSGGTLSIDGVVKIKNKNTLYTNNILPSNGYSDWIGSKDTAFNIYTPNIILKNTYTRIQSNNLGRWFRILDLSECENSSAIVSISKGYSRDPSGGTIFAVNANSYDVKNCMITVLSGNLGLIKKIRVVANWPKSYVDVYIDNFDSGTSEDYHISKIGEGTIINFEPLEEAGGTVRAEVDITIGFSCSSSLYGAGLKINGTASITGDTTINGNLTVANQLTIGNATLYWDVASQCLRVNAGIASDSFLSAKGIDTTGNGQGGGGGLDATMLWNELTIPSPTNAGKVIDPLFLPMEEIYSPISETFNALEKRVAALEKALTWQTL